MHYQSFRWHRKQRSVTKVLWVEELVSSLFGIKAEDQDINLALLFLKVMLYTFCRFFKKPSTNPMGNYGNENSKKSCAKTRSSCLYVYFVFCFFICCGVLFCFLLLVVGFEMWFLARAKGTAAMECCFQLFVSIVVVGGARY